MCDDREHQVTDDTETSLDRSAYRAIGLIANPFTRVRMRAGEGVGTALEIQSAGNRLLAALDVLADSPRSSVLWAEKTGGVPAYYYNAVLIYTQHELINDDELNILLAYIQLFTAKVGRVRSALNVIAERLATRSFDTTLACLIDRMIAEPADELLESDTTREAWEAFCVEFARDREAAVAGVLGTYERLAMEESERPTDTRAIALETEPDESDDSPETDVFTEALPVPVTAEEVAQTDPVLEYIVAYARARYSPVIARSLRVYLRDGEGALGDELKITKAPRKTLSTIIDLAGLRFRKVLMLFDGFDNWAAMPEELKFKYIGSLAEVRARAGVNAVMAFLIPTGAAPELEDQFAGSNRIQVGFPGVPILGSEGTALDADVVANWWQSAVLTGAEVPAFADTPLPAMIEDANGDLEVFCAAAEVYVADIARKGAW